MLPLNSFTSSLWWGLEKSVTSHVHYLQHVDFIILDQVHTCTNHPLMEGCKQFGAIVYVPPLSLKCILDCKLFSFMPYIIQFQQTDRHTDRHTDRQTNQQTNRHTDIQTNQQTNRPTNQQTNRPTDQQTNIIFHNVCIKISIKLLIMKHDTPPLVLFFTNNTIQYKTKTRQGKYIIYDMVYIHGGM